MENTNNDIRNGLLFIGACWAAHKIVNYEPKDTRNYSLLHRGKIVYEGISYDDVLDIRINRHRREGKVFDSCRYSQLKKRSMALDHEELRIRRRRPKYNIHHNC